MSWPHLPPTQESKCNNYERCFFKSTLKGQHPLYFTEWGCNFSPTLQTLLSCTHCIIITGKSEDMLFSAVSNVGRIRWSPHVRSTPQRQTTNQYADSLPDSQLLILKKRKKILCGLTAPSPIFIFSGEGINLTAKWSPTNTTHFKAAGIALENWPGSNISSHFYFQSETLTLPMVF